MANNFTSKFKPGNLTSNMKSQQENLASTCFFFLTKNLSYTTNIHSVKTPHYSNAKVTMDLSSDAMALCKQGRFKEALKRAQAMEGGLLHTHRKNTKFKPNIFLGNASLNTYAKCGRLADARRILEAMPKRNVVSWTAIIAAYAKQGKYEEALELFILMWREGIEPNTFTFSSVLPACGNFGSLHWGKEIHRDIIRKGCGANVFVGNGLVGMYAKCGRMDFARQVFDTMPERNAVSWTVMVAGYVQNGQVDEALEVFEMGEVDVACWTAMVGGYVQSGRIEDALKLFWKIPQRDTVAWTAMISGCVRNRQFDQALDLFCEMQVAGMMPNSETFSSVLPACANSGALEHGREVHENLIRSGFQSDVFVGSALIDMYAKCGRIEDARQIFDKMPERSVVSWNSIIVGYAQCGCIDEALRLFESMPERNVVSWNAMISGYAQNEQIDEALKLFQEMPERDVVSWTAMIGAYVQSGQVDEAMKLFDRMPQRNVMSWNTMIAGCVQLGNVDQGMALFQKMPKRDVVSWNTMVAGFAQNGNFDQALKLFRQMPEKDAISWTAMIAGCAQNGHFDEALKIFREMLLTGIKPTAEAFASVLPACANLAALNYGKEIHDSILRNGFQSDVFIGSALVDMYAKCGSIAHAHTVFQKMSIRDVVSWNAMILGYATYGLGIEAIQLFEEMLQTGINPTDITFVGVLSACCHAGLVNDGLRYFDSMKHIYHIIPTLEHCCCIVDLLGRAGHLKEAENFIKEMPMEPSVSVWMSLLGACRNHSNIELAERVADRLFHLYPKNVGPYVLLSNIYAEAGRWYDIEKVRKMMKDNNVPKKPGCSWIEINKRIYVFVVAGRSNPKMQNDFASVPKKHLTKCISVRNDDAETVLKRPLATLSPMGQQECYPCPLATPWTGGLKVSQF